jgi:hypothetical protein
MPVADVEGARDHHRQPAVCRLLKNRGRVFCWSGSVRIHTSTIDNWVTDGCSERYSHPTCLENTVEPRLVFSKERATTMPGSKLDQLVIDLVDAARDPPASVVLLAAAVTPLTTASFVLSTPSLIFSTLCAAAVPREETGVATSVITPMAGRADQPV